MRIRSGLNHTVLVWFTVISLSFSSFSFGATKGIYLTQSTAENTGKVEYFIKQAKAAGIDTFVIDLSRSGSRYAQNIAKVKKAGLKYVARIVIFPHGGTPDQVKNERYWAQKYSLVEKAILLGADRIQLDYIRYNTKQPARAQNAQDVLEVIKYFKKRTDNHKVPLEIDVFGESSFKPSMHIGQDVRVFAPHIDVLNPMLYPSHFKPFEQHAGTPYKTVYKSLQAVKEQFKNKPPFKIHAYIELSNYHYKWSDEKRVGYIKEQLRAVRDAGIDGWYAWSANNHYDLLFQVLREKEPVLARE